MTLTVDAQQPATDRSGKPASQSMVPSDQNVLNHLFAEQHVAESGVWVCRHVAKMQDEDALRYLLRWVIPLNGRDNFRVTVDFAAAENPVPLVDQRRAGESTDRPQIVSPALELIRRARTLEKLDSVRALVRASQARNAKARFDRQTLLALIAIAESETDDAVDLIDKLYRLVEADLELLEQTKAAVLLCATESLRFRELIKLSAETLPALTERYRKEYVRTAWHRHLWAAAADVQLAHSHSKAYDPSEQADPQWFPVSVSTARERGSAFPLPRWSMTPGSVRSLSSHADEFLYFRSPLSGNFAVETHATGFGYRESHVMVGGRWTGLVYNHRQFIDGHVRGEVNRHALTRELADTHPHGFIHTRLASRGTQISTFLNGHPVRQYPRGETTDPWVAIRSMYRVHGGVDDFRISGAPTVPEKINLIDSQELLSWYDFFYVPHLSTNRMGPWQSQFYENDQGENVSAIASRRSSIIPRGSHTEQLLVYSRPVLEDGEIEYDFWYAPDESLAHPCLAGTAYLISDAGVRLHRVTHGRYDRSPRRPDNTSAVDDSTNRPGIQLSKPSLKSNTWNRMRIRLVSDTLKLNLNGQDIYESKVSAPSLQRHFGLFHYADKTSLLVRNASWRGTWSRTIPPLAEQPLVSPEYAEQILLPAEFPDRFFHRFDLSPLNANGFSVVEGDPIHDVRITNDGLVVNRKGRPGYQSAMIGRPMKIQGDFDISVEFDQLERATLKGKIASVRLWAHASSDLNDTALVQMVLDRNAERTVQCMKMQTLEGKERRHYFGGQPMEATAGRLRLSRRGNAIYYLVAENDSQEFRIIGREEFSTADLDGGAVRFGVQVQDAGSHCTVRFKSFEIAAEKLTGIEVEDLQEALAKLNRSREELPLLFQHDFATKQPSADDFYLWTDTSQWKAADGGLVIRAPGAASWTSTGLATNPGYEGDFDILYRFHKMPMVTPQIGKHTQVYLQANLANQDQTQFSVMLTKTSEQNFVTQAQIRNRVQNNYKYSNIGDVAGIDPDFLRFARRGTKVYFLAGKESADKKSTDKEYVLASSELGDDPLPQRGVRIMLHTGHVEGESMMLARSFEVRAESMLSPDPILVPVPAGRQPTPQPSVTGRLLKSIQGLFQ